MLKKLVIISPCYNEELAVEAGVISLLAVLDDLIVKNKISQDSHLLLINDGSKDNTWSIIEKLLEKHNGKIIAISLAGNVGHQNALLCGYHNAQADMCISIDIDLQDDISKIEEMVDLYYNGYHIVHGVRTDRGNDSWFKKYSALLFYKLVKFFNPKTIENSADFRLMSSFAIDQLKYFSETNLYLRGIITSMGLRSSFIHYVRLERALGETKYTIVKMLSLAFDGIFAMSAKPLLLIHLFSIIFLLLSFCIFVWMIISLLSGHAGSGWLSIMGSIYLVGGFIMLSMSLLASYISRIYIDVKKRPLYFIEKIIK
jgi:glycosyltransferase involved in cell wall biosynthesis